MDNTNLLRDFDSWNPSSDGTRRLQTHHARRFLNDHDPQTVTPTEVSAWIRKPHWNPNSQTAAYTSMGKFFRWYCVITQQRLDNPMALVDRPKPKRGVPRPVPEAMLDTFRANANSEDDLLMFDLGSLQGIRRAEIASLRVDNIDIERNVLIISGKGGRVRTLPIHANVIERLKKRAESPRSEWVFPSPSGNRPLHPRTIGRRMSFMMGREYTTHQLRHRFATAIYKASNNDIRVTQELLGHASVATTQIYTAVDSAALNSAMSRL